MDTAPKFIADFKILPTLVQVVRSFCKLTGYLLIRLSWWVSRALLILQCLIVLVFA